MDVTDGDPGLQEITDRHRARDWQAERCWGAAPRTRRADLAAPPIAGLCHHARATLLVQRHFSPLFLFWAPELWSKAPENSVFESVELQNLLNDVGTLEHHSTTRL